MESLPLHVFESLDLTASLSVDLTASTTHLLTWCLVILFVVTVG